MIVLHIFICKLHPWCECFNFDTVVDFFEMKMDRLFKWNFVQTFWYYSSSTSLDVRSSIYR